MVNIPRTKIVLYQPKLAGNFGNIIRTCSVTNTDLSYVTPIPFTLDDKELKRAGIDYIDDVHLSVIIDFNKWLDQYANDCVFFSAHAKQYCHDVDLKNKILVFGNEVSGLPEEIVSQYPNQFVKIPMASDKRCYNLSNSVSIGIYQQILHYS